ncbi:MAG: hypothetical protein JWM89_2531 [Acidimicrobiales bacterium]|nr:hypothetical protein [Acidimicrobiales bacterium]
MTPGNVCLRRGTRRCCAMTLAAAVALVGLAGCGASDRGASEVDNRSGKPLEASGKGVEVVGRSQRVATAGPVVDSVTLAKPGFVAVFADAKGAPGELLGSSRLLKVGAHRDVAVRLTTKLKRSTAVFVIPFADTDGDGKIGWPTGDQPIGTDRGLVLVRLRLKP